MNRRNRAASAAAALALAAALAPSSGAEAQTPVSGAYRTAYPAAASGYFSGYSLPGIGALPAQPGQAPGVQPTLMTPVYGAVRQTLPPPSRPESPGAVSVQAAVPSGSAAGKAADSGHKKTASVRRAVPGAAVPGMRIRGIAYAADGITLVVAGQRIRLAGIEVPAGQTLCRAGLTAWRCGEEAEADLDRIARRAAVDCIVTGVSGGIADGICRSARDNIAAEMLQDGFAVTADPALAGYMNRARADRRGIWYGTGLAGRNRPD